MRNLRVRTRQLPRRFILFPCQNDTIEYRWRRRRPRSTVLLLVTWTKVDKSTRSRHVRRACSSTYCPSCRWRVFFRLADDDAVSKKGWRRDRRYWTITKRGLVLSVEYWCCLSTPTWIIVRGPSLLDARTTWQSVRHPRYSRCWRFAQSTSDEHWETPLLFLQKRGLPRNR